MYKKLAKEKPFILKISQLVVTCIISNMVLHITGEIEKTFIFILFNNILIYFNLLNVIVLMQHQKVQDLADL